ncbi:hypothetical protein ACLMJK_009728 [Lecanora helva]
MDLANLLSHDPPRPDRPSRATDVAQAEPQRPHQYPTRHSTITGSLAPDNQPFAPPHVSHVPGNNLNHASPTYSMSPEALPPKHVAFELLFDGGTTQRGRLPMRVQIFPHDTTESIVTTVKNFYGLYDGGVIFEDERGNTLIARYENFHNGMVVYIRVAPDYSQAHQAHAQVPAQAVSPINGQRIHTLEEPFQMPPPQPAQALTYGQPISRPPSRTARKKSTSPRPGRNSRNPSVQKSWPRGGVTSREESFQSQLDNLNSDNTKGYASSDGEGGSVTSSRKARSEQLASAEISVDNILDGNRRKRAKFESSELPLFVPPQVPAPNSISSISPQRRSNGQDNPSPFAKPMQRSFIYNQPLQSPQSSGYGENPYGPVSQNNTPITAPPSMESGRRLRDRANAPTLSARSSAGILPRVQGIGILPTPDPTIASTISDEDVALQLMRLGDASNVSHGRTSASTLDETLSGRADIASSVTSDVEQETDETEQPSLPRRKGGMAPQPRRSMNPQKSTDDVLPSTDSAEPSDDEIDEDYRYDGNGDGIAYDDPDNVSNEFQQVTKARQAGLKQRNGTRMSSASSLKNTTKVSKQRSNAVAKKSKTSNVSAGKTTPPVPVLPQPRKTSSASTVNFQNQGEEDLSTKPRCQRCRKSKKGCDRQRPCQRCKDAGIGIDGCISEDEGNGRKGRFGRHMGVAVKQEVQVPTQAHETEEAGAILDAMAGNPEKSKKRKR